MLEQLEQNNWTMSNPVCTFDFTIPACIGEREEPEHYVNEQEIKDWCREHTKKWAFQLEMSEEGYLHFQGRVSLKQKKRLDYVKKNLKLYPQMHWSITSTANRDNFFYVMKEDTRIEGPWTDKDVEIVIPRQIREIVDNKEWYPWQRYLMDHIHDWEPRTVNCIYDPVGNKGKSTVSTYLCVTRAACQIPTCNDYKDVLASVIDRDKLGAYLIDMPRGIHKESLGNFYGAIETIKSGNASDKRYKFREVFFDSPNVWVFTNILPDKNLLSKDRWKIWSINSKKELVPYEEGAPVELPVDLPEPTFVGFPEELTIVTLNPETSSNR